MVRSNSNITNIAKMEGHTDCVTYVAFTADGKSIVSVSKDNTIRIWNVVSGAETAKMEGHADAVGSVAFSPDGKLIGSGCNDNTVRIWDVASGAETAKMEGHTDRAWTVAFSSDGKSIVSGSIDYTVRIWDVASGAETAKMEGHFDRVWSVSFSADGKSIVSGSDDETVRIWDVASGAQTAKMEGHTNAVGTVMFSPDDKSIVSGSDDETVRIWDVASGAETAKMEGHTSEVNSVAFSPDGKSIVSGASDNTVRIWDVASGAETAKMKGHTGFVKSVTFSADGKIIVSGSYDKTIRLWNVSKSQTVVHSPFTSISNNNIISPESMTLRSKVDDYDNDRFSVGIEQYDFDIGNSDIPILFADKKQNMKVFMKSRLETLLKDDRNIMYECKSEVPTTSLYITNKKVLSQSFLQTSVLGISSIGAALVKTSDVEEILKDNKKTRITHRQKKTIKELSTIASSATSYKKKINATRKLFLKDEKITPKIYTFVRTNKKIDRVASQAVINGENVVGAHHCQEQQTWTVYTLKEVTRRKTRLSSKKGSKKRMSLF
jgi:WD40 repeat protein